MTGVMYESRSTGPTVQELKFISYTAKCSCGWRSTTTDWAGARDVRAIGEAHREVCLG